jgi:PKD repeat protein
MMKLTRRVVYGGMIVNDGGATTSNDDYRYAISIKEIVLDGSGFTGWSWDGHIVKKVGLKGTLNFNDDTDDGYTIEVAIPWTDLGIFPAVGKIFGLQIGVTDRDTESDYEYFGWPIHDSSFNNPDGWAKVRLASSSSSGTNRPPVLSDFTASPSDSNNPGEEVTYQIIANDPDGDSLTYSVDFGDGTSSGTGNVVRHEYATSGIYTARATIDDGHHGHTVTKTLQITVGDQPPAAPTSIYVH